MLESKRFERAAAILMAAVLLLSLLAVAQPGMFERLSREQDSLQYPEKLFGQSVIEIDISMAEDDWDSMIENKMTKEYRACDLTINGETFHGVGIRTKGNSSLTSVQGERLSFRFDFDHYVYNQTCYGLRQMVVNNLQADATYMKDYVAYDLMEKMGVPAPLHTFAFLTVNGKDFGVYLAAEVYEKEFLQRESESANAALSEDAVLYSVKSSGMDTYEAAEIDPETGNVIANNGYVEASGMGMDAPPGTPPDGMMGPPDFQQQGGAQGTVPGGQQPSGEGVGLPAPDGGETQSVPAMPPMGEGETAPIPPENGESGQPIPTDEGENGWNQIPGPPPGGGPGGPGGGGDLVYTDGNTENYSNIFGNAVFDTTTAKDYGRIIRAIYVLNQENVTEGELDQYWNVDEILRYFAVHNFMVNSDSYTGNMLQNYYLAECDGRIAVLPWDYNLSFGMMGGPGENGQAPDVAAGGENFMPPLPGGGNSAEEATEIVNFAIDTPVFGATVESRPLLSVLLKNETLRDRYHQYLQELVSYTGGTAEENAFAQKLIALNQVLEPYIQRETATFFTPEEHATGFAALLECIRLRSESIQKQLNGEIASETEAQDAATLVQATFSLSDLGSMGGGPGKGGPNGMGDPPGGGMGGGMPPPPPPGGMGGPPPGGMGGPGDMGGGMPPLPPGGFSEGSRQLDRTDAVTIGAAAAVLAVGILLAKLFKRQY